MALKHIILGTLATLGPQSRYGIYRIFSKPNRPKLPQIYKVMKDLGREKLVKFERVPGEKNQEKNVYTITQTGLDTLKKWLDTKNDVGLMDNSLLQRIWYASLCDKEIILDDISSFLEFRKAEIKYYENQFIRSMNKATVRRFPHNPVDHFYNTIVTKYLIDRAKADVKWAQATLKEISRVDLTSLD